jgi:hypothetical protein
MYDFYHRVLVKQFEVRGKSTTLNFTFTFTARAVSIYTKYLPTYFVKLQTAHASPPG